MLIATAGVVLAAGMTMTWVRVPGADIDVRGIDASTSVQVLVLSQAAALLVLGCIRRRLSAVLAIVLSITVAWRGVLILRDGVALAASDLGDVSFGPGTWLVFASSILALAGGAILLGELARAPRGDRG
ncbi:MAG: hypothetical protein WD739_05015 [Actinomycetota bacterium]